MVVASLDHARRGVEAGFIMANHGKLAPLRRMQEGDRVLVYSPRTAFPMGESFQAVAIVGVVTGAEPEPSDVIEGGYRRRADLREVPPIPLAEMRGHLPTTKLRSGCFELSPPDADAIWSLVPKDHRRLLPE